MFYKKSVLQNFAKLTGKHLCQSLSLTKLQASTLLKKDSGIGTFLRILRNFKEHLFFLTENLCKTTSAKTKPDG